jgi:hypothetical protein
MKRNIAGQPNIGRGGTRPPQVIAGMDGGGPGDRYRALLACLKHLADVVVAKKKGATDPATARSWTLVRNELSLAAWSLAQFNLSPHADFLIAAAASSLEYAEAKIQELLDGPDDGPENGAGHKAPADETDSLGFPVSQNFCG